MLKAKRFKQSPRPLSKRKLFSFLFYFIFVLLSFYVATPSSVVLPEEDHPLVLYHGPKKPLNQLVFSAIEQAKKSIYIECYAIDYPPLLERIKRACERGVQVEIYYDPKVSNILEKTFPGHLAQAFPEGTILPNPLLRPYIGRALMHRKLLIGDGENIYFGSANFTAGSLLHHENVMIGIRNPALASYLKNASLQPKTSRKKGGTGQGFILETPQYRVQIFRLPEEKSAAQTLLYKQLQAAKKTIDVAMFTFTHTKIAEILEERSLSGVDVQLILDHKQKWLSEKLLPSLVASGVQIKTHAANQLFHHKWAWIDQKTWIVGSANWTKNGFTYNSELIAFFEVFDPKLSLEIDALWRECNNF